MLIFNFTLSIFTYFRYYENMLHKNTSQCKILIVPEEGWFGQLKYRIPSKKSSYVVSVSAFIFLNSMLNYCKCPENISQTRGMRLGV